MKVYLAGPITGCDDDEANDWRTIVGACIGRAGHQVLDPMDWADMRGKELEPGVPQRIVKLDKRAIRDADVMFVNALQGVSVGTTMEILYAYNCSVPVVLVTRQQPLSPWYQYHADEIEDNLPDGVNTLGFWLQMDDYRLVQKHLHRRRKERGCVELGHCEGSEVWE